MNSHKSHSCLGFLDRIFRSRDNRKQPEDHFLVTITNEFVQVEHPHRQTERIEWNNIREIRMVNTNTGPFLPDVWLALMGETSGCLIPQGAKGFDEVYNTVSKYEGFNFENVSKSMAFTGNGEFHLWKKSTK